MALGHQQAWKRIVNKCFGRKRLFEILHKASTRCAPSRCSLLTGAHMGMTTVWECAQAVHLKGQERTTHPFARLTVAGQCLHTCVMWQTTEPAWQEKLTFKCAPSRRCLNRGSLD